MIGTIEKYVDGRGFGFIKIEGRARLEYFHISQWQGAFEPTVGQRVQFEVEQELRASGRSYAVNVTPLAEAGQATLAAPVAAEKNAMEAK